jgi:hypothetical protein
MPKGTKLTARSVLATFLALAGCTVLTAPQAAWASGSSVSITFTAQASAETRAVAATDPEDVHAAAVECGSGYELYYAERLPTADNRLGTLWIYNKLSGSTWSACAIFDNNTTSAKYMKLKICPDEIAGTCSEDAGNFSSYAGPVHLTDAQCGTVTALMKNTSSSTTYLINAVRGATPCD